jgi:hypothetical protein
MGPREVLHTGIREALFLDILCCSRLVTSGAHGIKVMEVVAGPHIPTEYLIGCFFIAMIWYLVAWGALIILL